MFESLQGEVTGPAAQESRGGASMPGIGVEPVATHCLADASETFQSRTTSGSSWTRGEQRATALDARAAVEKIAKYYLNTLNPTKYPVHV